MTNDERDNMIRATHDKVMEIAPMVNNHDKTLYGNGQPGLKEQFATHVEAEKHCAAKLAFSVEGKKFNISMVMMVVAIIGLMASVALGIINAIK